jgi:hypothetical protein
MICGSHTDTSRHDKPQFKRHGGPAGARTSWHEYSALRAPRFCVRSKSPPWEPRSPSLRPSTKNGGFCITTRQLDRYPRTSLVEAQGSTEPTTRKTPGRNSMSIMSSAGTLTLAFPKYKATIKIKLIL